MKQNNRPRVFISHSHQDNEFVEKLAEDIEDAGVNCWLDLWEIQVGDSLRKKVEGGIKAADWLVVILSQFSVKSKWVEQELNMGFVRELENRNVFILPIVIDQCEIPLSLRDKLYADFRHDYQHGLDTVTTRILNISPSERARLRRFRRYCAQCDQQLPLFATLFASVLDAGFTTSDSLRFLSEELPEPICNEVKQLSQDFSPGVDLADALSKLLKRVPTYRMQLFVITARVACQTGTLVTALSETKLEQIEEGKLL
jgi:hypothetical protein